MKVKEVIHKLQEIKQQGYIPSKWKGATGFGYTFEKVFGINENNIPIPDIGGRVEIKTVRRNSQSLVTLFTFNPKWVLSLQKFVQQKVYQYITIGKRLKKIIKKIFRENNYNLN